MKKNDVVSALFSLSCPRKLLVDPPVVISGLESSRPTHEELSHTNVSLNETWSTHMWLCLSSPAAQSHTLMHCHWLKDVNQGRWWNLVEGLPDSLLCDVMWIPLCLTCRMEVRLWPQQLSATWSLYRRDTLVGTIQWHQLTAQKFIYLHKDADLVWLNSLVPHQAILNNSTINNLKT